jgi:hypothetical protein
MARPLRIEYPGAFYHGTCKWGQTYTIDSKVFIRIIGIAGLS